MTIDKTPSQPRHWFIGCSRLSGINFGERKAYITTSMRRVTCEMCKTLIMNAWFYYFKNLDWALMTDEDEKELKELAETRTEHLVPRVRGSGKSQTNIHDFSVRRIVKEH